MAITVTAVNPSSPNIFSTIPSLKIQSLSPSSFTKFTVNLVSNEAPFSYIPESMKAVALASPAIHDAREAVRLISGKERERIGNGDLAARRKKRRKRRKGFDCLVVEEEEKEKDDRFEKAFIEDVNGDYLSPIEEAKLCLCLKDNGRLEAARKRIAETQEHEPTSKQLAKALKLRKKNVDIILYKGRESRERIIHNYRNLVVSIAKTYQGKGLSLEELIQDGIIGLLRGAERFDSKRGSKLSTYVYWWIKEAIIRSISSKSRLVRLPGRMKEKITKIAEAQIALEKGLGRFPSYDEIAEFANIHFSTVRIGFESSRSPVSLDRVVSDQGRMTLQEIIPGPEEMIPENMIKRQLMKQELEKLLQTLSEREAYILRSYFGLNGQTPHSLEEIGESSKLCRERVRQIKSIAISKLGTKSIIENLKVYIV